MALKRPINKPNKKTAQSSAIAKKDSAKKNQKLKGLKYIAVGLVLLNVAGLLWLTQYALDRKSLLADANKIDMLLVEDIDKIKGYACGIFSQAKAETFLGTKTEQKILNVSIPAKWDGDENLEIRHTDGCYYEALDTTGIYAQVLFETYPDEAYAADRFDHLFPPVADLIEKEGLVKGADRVVYDAGVHYILTGRQAIQVAASNGNPAESEAFSEKLVRIVESSL